MNNPIAIPEMCGPHQRRLVRAMKTDLIVSTVMVANIMLFTAATASDKVWQRCSPLPDGSRNGDDLSLVLAEIGCLACNDEIAYGRVLKLMTTKEPQYVADISMGKIRDDPDWPYLRGEK